jgi:hypothetical protein
MPSTAILDAEISAKTTVFCVKKPVTCGDEDKSMSKAEGSIAISALDALNRHISHFKMWGI